MTNDKNDGYRIFKMSKNVKDFVTESSLQIDITGEPTTMNGKSR